MLGLQFFPAGEFVQQQFVNGFDARLPVAGGSGLVFPHGRVKQLFVEPGLFGLQRSDFVRQRSSSRTSLYESRVRVLSRAGLAGAVALPAAGTGVAGLAGAASSAMRVRVFTQSV